MKQIHYIDKSYPITLQDLIDLARNYNQDPRDLKLIMNSELETTRYVQCALLNQDPGSIDLYPDGYTPTH